MRSSIFNSKSSNRTARMPQFAMMIATAIVPWSPAQAQDRSQARSMVITRYGIVATEQPLASQIGVRILEEGGNAVGAAVAANAALGLVAPMMNGIGGDRFAIV